MALKQVIEVYELMENPVIEESMIKEFFINRGLDESEIEIRKIKEDKEETQFAKITIRGKEGKLKGKSAPTLGVIGNLGGIGARPHKIGLVSDADGAITALASAAKLVEMRTKGDELKCNVIVTTHLCPRSPIIPHEPVPFIGSPVSMDTMNKFLVAEEMEAILSIDTTKGNRVINYRGFAISPTVKDGYILRISEDLLEIMQIVTGKMPVVFPITTQDITPYGNRLYHLNSIMQPATVTSSPVVGVAITTEVPIPGCATGANHCLDIEMATRFVIEVAKAWGEGECSFYNEKEFNILISLYGSQEHFKTLGRN